MNNDLTEKENRLKTNWKWLVPSILLGILLVGVLISSISKEGVTDIVQAYSDNLLFEKAIEKANRNSNILKEIGKIAPIDKLAILEGNILYSNNYNTVSLSVRVNGTKRKGKLNIFATRKGTDWNYKKISIRTKNPNNEIVIPEELLR